MTPERRALRTVTGRYFPQSALKLGEDVEVVRLPQRAKAPLVGSDPGLLVWAVTRPAGMLTQPLQDQLPERERGC